MRKKQESMTGKPVSIDVYNLTSEKDERFGVR